MTDSEFNDFNAAQLRRAQDFMKLLMDLDRCPHGRHEGDDCAGWSPEKPGAGCRGGVSLGNPILRTNAIIGYGMDGRPIVMPGRADRHRPENWRPL